ncbi:serpentine type 7TM GPCR chemoreceptor srsx domain-containing protein [Ditylenchus destructor]|uniref:Serpentine type 7TM GPCR chemoreceptor srsx domain-containing protein n=1 Tax=Ditylenchus destructor TaxID=166010 RepID=A0AAD4R3W4_9BILA|nr:serpentine type 7TM GPCR chemoreceptor srsx domain-containing protein [Ditylenchus destructor]
MAAANNGYITEFSTVAPDPFYNAFKDTGFAPAISSVSLIYAILSAFGIGGNSTIVFVTLTNRSLQGTTCNYLLAALSFFDIFHQMSHFWFAYVTISGRNFIGLWTCLNVQTIPLFGLNMAQFLLLFIGMDRFFSLLLPNIHESFNKRIYVFLVLVICASCSSYFVILAYQFALQNPNVPVTCVLPECYRGYLVDLFFRIWTILNILTVLFYAAIWGMMRKATTSSETTRRLFKSILIITLVLMLGFLTTGLLRTVTSYLPPSALNSEK